MTQDFFSLYSPGFIRIATWVPRMKAANVSDNLAETIRLAKEGDAAKAALMLFPELGLSAYAIDDLLFQDALQDAVQSALAKLAEASRDLFPTLVVGAPLQWQGALFNTAIVIHKGSVLGAVPKIYLPNYREFYERRYFRSGAGLRNERIMIAGMEVPFGIDLLFRSTGS